MYDMSSYAIPKPNAQFRPRADAGFISAALQNAWKSYEANLFTSAETAHVGALLAMTLEKRYPEEDMLVLRRYNMEATIEETVVTLYDPEVARWDAGVRIKLPRPIMTPAGYDPGRFSTGPRWSEEPLLGLKPKYFDTLTPEAREELRLDHARREESYVPRETEPYFEKLLVARKAFQAEYKVATDWPEAERKLGRPWPTWAEIETKFPVLGAYVQALRELRKENRTAA
jgi:hypothetical protein